jgi:hypothetical protein
LGTKISGGENISKDENLLAEISHHCVNFDLSIKNLQTSDYELNEKCWQIVMKILWYISGNNAFFSRLVDSESVWLYTDWKKHTFQRYSKPENFSSDANTVKEVLRLFLGIYEN